MGDKQKYKKITQTAPPFCRLTCQKLTLHYKASGRNIFLCTEELFLAYFLASIVVSFSSEAQITKVQRLPKDHCFCIALLKRKPPFDFYIHLKRSILLLLRPKIYKLPTFSLVSPLFGSHRISVWELLPQEEWLIHICPPQDPPIWIQDLRSYLWVVIILAWAPQAGTLGHSDHVLIVLAHQDCCQDKEEGLPCF